MNNYLVESYRKVGLGYEITGSWYANTKEEAYKIASKLTYYIIWNLYESTFPTWESDNP